MYTVIYVFWENNRFYFMLSNRIGQSLHFRHLKKCKYFLYDLWSCQRCMIKETLLGVKELCNNLDKFCRLFDVH